MKSWQIEAAGRRKVYSPTLLTMHIDQFVTDGEELGTWWQILICKYHSDVWVDF